MTRQEVIVRLCQLQTEAAEHVGWEHAADCFCGQRNGFGISSDDPKFADDYRNDGAALEFIERAVRAAIAHARETRPPDER